eukprot:769242-Pyramimonas_sp.AAC.2
MGADALHQSRDGSGRSTPITGREQTLSTNHGTGGWGLTGTCPPPQSSACLRSCEKRQSLPPAAASGASRCIIFIII